MVGEGMNESVGPKAAMESCRKYERGRTTCQDYDPVLYRRQFEEYQDRKVRAPCPRDAGTCGPVNRDDQGMVFVSVHMHSERTPRTGPRFVL